MSVIRLSFVEDTLRQTNEVGDLALAEAGELERFGDDRPEFGKTLKLDQYLADELRTKSAKLTDKTPVVVMVHGFWYDPTPKVDLEHPEKSGNPHGLNYHFSTPEKPHWRHTASWPAGFGIQDNRKAGVAEAGANGLAAVIGWDSTPAVLKPGAAGRKAWGEAATALTARVISTPREALRKDLTDAAAALDDLDENEKAKQLSAAVKDCVAKSKDKSVLGGIAFARSVSRLIDLIGQTLEVISRELIPLVDVIAKYAPEVYSEAYKRALPAASVVANTIHALNAKLPDRPIDVFCHSLGSRVVVQALRQIAKAKPALLNPKNGVGRVIIVGGAEYKEDAREMLRAVENATRGDCPTFYNFMSRRDRVLTHLAGLYHPVAANRDRPIGCYGLDNLKMNAEPHWIDLQLDKDKDGNHRLSKWLTSERMMDAVSGSPEGAVSSTHPLGVLNHWYYFTNAANMSLFRAILTNRSDWKLDVLREKRIPESEVGVV